MKEFLEKLKGKKIGVIRAGVPKEVYFEGTVKEVVGDSAVFEIDSGKIAVNLDKILVAGDLEKSSDEARSPAGFLNADRTVKDG